MGTTLVRYQSRRNTAAQWTTANEVLLAGEPGYESDTGRLKLGDGSTAWTGLRYADAPVGVDPTAKDFGAKGDGTTDDTAALQAFVTYVVTNGLAGVIPAGSYKITSRINFPARPGWSIRGVHRLSTRIVQATDNTPIFWLGSDTSSLMHTYRISDLEFTYTNSQPATNLNAVPIWFNTMAFEGNHERLVFTRGSYAYNLTTGIGCPWGSTWNDLQFTGGLTKGAMSWTGGANATPNNHFGRIFCDCANMVGPVFAIRGYNFVIDTIEFIGANQGAKLITFDAGTEVTIGAVKLENGTYTAGQNIFEHLGGGQGYTRIGQLAIGGSTMNLNPASGTVYLFNQQSGGTAAPGGATTEIGYIHATATTLTGAVYLIGAGNRVRVGRIVATNGWPLQNQGSSTAAEYITVDEWANPHVSLDKGDVNTTVAMGDPTTIIYNTPLTAPRTVTLPGDNNQFNGLTYEVVSAGAVNGTNTITVVSGSTTLGTITADKTRLRFTWRRSNGTSRLCWFVSGSGGLP